MKKSEHLKTCNIKRNLPAWAKVVKNINGLPIYNMNIFDNIMSWNQEHKDIPAFDYYGFQITYGELPQKVEEYVGGLTVMGINNTDVVTLCMPVSIFIRVLLPAPFSPINATTSPDFSSSAAFLSACTPEKLLFMFFIFKITSFKKHTSL